MNPLVVEVISTIATMAAFVTVVAWAYSGRRSEAFRQAARLPLTDDADSEHTRG